MRVILAMLAVLCWAAAGFFYLAIASQTNSAIHEIEAILMFIGGCIMVGFVAVVDALDTSKELMERINNNISGIKQPPGDT